MPVVQVEAFEAPLSWPVSESARFVLKDPEGRVFITPRGACVRDARAIKKAKADGQPMYEMEGRVFMPLDWLFSDAWPAAKLPKIRKVCPADVPMTFYTAMTERLPGRSVEVKVVRSVSDVFSKH